MPAIHIYSMPQVIHLTVGGLIGATMIYSHPQHDSDIVRLYTGITNPIDFLLCDIDRKPVTLAAGESLVLTMTDARMTREVMTPKTLTVVDAARGHFRATFAPADITVPEDWYSYSITKVNAAAVETPIYVDRDHKPSGRLQVLRGKAPTTLDPQFTLLGSEFHYLNGHYHGGTFPGSRTHADGLDDLHTATITLTGFTGTVYIDATEELDMPRSEGPWRMVASTTLTANTGTTTLPFSGPYRWIRFRVSKSAGTIERATLTIS